MTGKFFVGTGVISENVAELERTVDRLSGDLAGAQEALKHVNESNKTYMVELSVLSGKHQDMIQQRDNAVTELQLLQNKVRDLVKGRLDYVLEQATDKELIAELASRQ